MDWEKGLRGLEQNLKFVVVLERSHRDNDLCRCRVFLGGEGRGDSQAESKEVRLPFPPPSL